MKGSDLTSMMKGAPAPKAPMPAAEPVPGGSLQEEADAAAREFVSNPTAETFRALMTLCEELDVMSSYEDA
jgi:hypothetical protein